MAVMSKEETALISASWDLVAADIHEKIKIAKDDIDKLGLRLQQLQKRKEAYVAHKAFLAENQSVRANQQNFERKRLKEVSAFFIYREFITNRQDWKSVPSVVL